MKTILIISSLGMAMTASLTMWPAETVEEITVPAPYVSHALPQYTHFKQKYKHKKR